MATLAVTSLPAAPPAGAVEITTNYPRISVNPGDSVTLDLVVTGQGRERVDLTVTEVPEGWRARLHGGGFTIGAVTTDPEEPPEVKLTVSVPRDAEGTGRVVVRASAPSGTQDLPIDLVVTEGAPGAVSLEADFPVLEGKSSDTFQFDLTLRNDSPQAATFTLDAAGPEGWEVSARPSSQQLASTVTVEGGSTAQIQVSADPPDNVKAGKYDIGVRASSDVGTADAQLTVQVAGETRMTLTTADERLNASGTAGKATAVTLFVNNEGSSPLEGVSFSASPPSGWEVTFEPEQLDVVEPGERAQVTARIRPKGDAVAGDYSVSITATAGGESENVELRFAVESGFGVGLVGLLIIAAAIGGLVWVFRTYGRR